MDAVLGNVIAALTAVLTGLGVPAEHVEAFGTLYLLGAGFGGLWLFSKTWTWIVLFFFGGLAALFTMLAAIFHFQILLALGMFVVLFICGAVAFHLLMEEVSKSERARETAITEEQALYRSRR